MAINSQNIPEPQHWIVTTDGQPRRVNGVEAPGDGTAWLCPWPWHETRRRHFRAATQEEIDKALGPDPEEDLSIPDGITDEEVVEAIQRALRARPHLGAHLLAKVAFDGRVSPEGRASSTPEKTPAQEKEEGPTPASTGLAYDWAGLRAMKHVDALKAFEDATGVQVDGRGWDALESAYTAYQAAQAKTPTAEADGQ